VQPHFPAHTAAELDGGVGGVGGVALDRWQARRETYDLAADTLAVISETDPKTHLRHNSDMRIHIRDHLNAKRRADDRPKKT
jgi:hypothetical protein